MQNSTSNLEPYQIPQQAEPLHNVTDDLKYPFSDPQPIFEQEMICQKRLRDQVDGDEVEKVRFYKNIKNNLLTGNL